MAKEYDENSLFCSECTENHGLKDKIFQHSQKGLCSICVKEAKFVVRFDDLANWLEQVWSEWFHVGAEQPVFYADSDKPDYEQQGDEPTLFIGELVQCSVDEESVTQTLIDLMSRGDHYEIMQGGEPLMDDCQLYQERRLKSAEVEQYWNRFALDLKHHTRYFNTGSMEFFDKLFADLSEVHLPSTGKAIPFQLPEKLEPSKPVVRECPPGSLAVFRARKVGNYAARDAIIQSPESELSNPPDSLAAEGRMNPKGISYFYGAEDRETCVAELRPSISEKVISAEFELIEAVRLLDLTLLSKGYHQSAESMFDDDYLEKRVYRQLLRQLHRRIAQPVLGGDELEYLPTQAMAEYLARRTNPRVDGIIFESVQREGGRNMVFFPHVLRNENHSAVDFMIDDSAISLKPNTLVLHEVTRIEHSFKDREILNGQPNMQPEDYSYGDDWDYL